MEGGGGEEQEAARHEASVAHVMPRRILNTAVWYRYNDILLHYEYHGMVLYNYGSIIDDDGGLH